MAMLPEDRLDALLTLRVEHRSWQGDSPSPHGLNGDDGLGPLLVAAGRLADLGSADPSPTFADQLEALFLARAAYLEERDGVAGRFREEDTETVPLLPIIEAPPLLGNDDPTLPGIAWASLPDDATETEVARIRRPSATHSRAIWRRLLWPAIAAALVLAIGMTTFTAAADAGPGSALYGLRLWEQNVQVSLAGDAASRTRLHLGYARDALAALNTAASSDQTGSTYDDALATFQDEISAAASNLDGVPSGQARDILSGQLEQLRAEGRSDLRTALTALPWPERIATTSALAEIGDNVLQVTHADMVYSEHGVHGWNITVTGSGFQQGAALLVNGQLVGTVTSVTSTQLIAQVPGYDSRPPTGGIGVANPDNTAAATTNVTRQHHGDDGTPEAQQTPGSDDHSGSGHDATPSPTSSGH